MEQGGDNRLVDCEFISILYDGNCEIICEVNPKKNFYFLDLTILPVSQSTGSVEVSSVSAALRTETCLVTVMLANNETGVVQPIKDICEAIREKPNHDYTTPFPN